MIHVNVRAIIERSVSGTKEIIIQTRTVPGQEKLELPGGHLNEYESMYDGLKREILEETGLNITGIENTGCRIDTSDMGYSFSMECTKPFAVYQTLKGPVDSMGVYFKCSAAGTVAEKGDFTKEIRWIQIGKLHELVRNHKELFSDIDIAGILYYLNEELGNCQTAKNI